MKVLLVGIRLEKELGAKMLTVKSDSQLVIGQAQVETLEGFTLLHVPREQNERANLLAKLASMQKGGLDRIVIQEVLGRLTIEKTKDKMPENPQEARRIKREATKYVLIGKPKQSKLLKKFTTEHVEAILVGRPWPAKLHGQDSAGRLLKGIA
ncbi:hypothetical protein CR513_26880, partial [Mucuna pruriens]